MLLAFWQFASLAMLGWTAAAVAPILIHLFARKRFRRVTWAAMEYLLAAAKKNQRRIQVEQWLLLTVRTLLLLILALALADPIRSASNLLPLSGAAPPTHRVFVLDATYSMAAREGGKSRWDLATQAIRDAVEKSPQGDGFSLVLISDPPRVVIAEPAFSKSDLLDELDAATLTHGLGDVAGALGEVESIVAAARKQHARLVATNVIFLGDLEQNTWQSLTEAGVQSRVRKLADTASLELVDFGINDLRNTAILSATVRESPVTIDRECTIAAEIAAFGPTSSSAHLVTLLIDDEPAAQQSIALDSGGRGSVSFRHRFATPGDHVAEVRLADDALPLDGHRWLAIPVRESLKVLCVFSRPGDARYAALALEPDPSLAARAHVDQAVDSVLLEQDLRSYDAVVLVNLARIDSEQSLILRNYLEAGGGLIVFPGDQLQPREFFAAKDSDQPSLLPIEFTELSATGSYRFAPLDYRHELIAPFRGFEKAGLLTTPIWKYAKLRIPESGDARIALRFDSGDPAIVEARVGRGRAVVFTTAGSADSVDRSTEPPTPWTALPTWPSFPPLMQEALALVTRGQEESQNRIVGEPLSTSVASSSPSLQVNMYPPAGANANPSGRAVKGVSDGELVRYSFNETQVSGEYQLRFGAPLDRNQLFAVNLDARESELLHIDTTLLPSGLLDAKGESATRLLQSGAVGSTNAWFRTLLGFVLLLLASESFLAQRFGGGRA